MAVTNESLPASMAVDDQEIFLWNSANRVKLNGQQPQNSSPKRMMKYLPGIVRRNWLLSLILIGIFAALGFTEIRSMWLAQNGTRATATVTRRNVTETRRRGSIQSTFSLSYRYSTNKGMSYSVTEAVGERVYSQYSEGDHIAIFYDPNNPGFAQVMQTIPSFPVGAALCAAAVAVIAGITAYNYLQANHQRDQERIIRGEVVRCTGERKGSEASPHIQVELLYQFYAPDGSLRKNSVRRIMTLADYATFACPKAGTRVAVMYWNERSYSIL